MPRHFDPLENQVRVLENRGIEVVLIVLHHNQDESAALHLVACIAEDLAHRLDVAGNGGVPASSRSRTHLLDSAVVEPEQLVRIAVLLVVVDKTWVGRRRDDACRSLGEHDGFLKSWCMTRTRAFVRSGANARIRVTVSAVYRAQEFPSRLDGTTRLLVLEAVVRFRRRLAREVKIEVRREP